MSQAGIEGALALINVGIRALTLLQVGQPVLQKLSNLIGNAVKEGRELTDEEVETVRDGAETSLADLEKKVE